jgi:hypothetical protein
MRGRLLNGAGERIAGPVEAIAGIEQADDALIAPLLDLGLSPSTRRVGSTVTVENVEAVL